MKSSYPFDRSKKRHILYYREDYGILKLWEPLELTEMVLGVWYDCTNQITGMFGQCCIEQHGDGNKGKGISGIIWKQPPPDWNVEDFDDIVILNFLGEFSRRER